MSTERQATCPNGHEVTIEGQPICSACAADIERTDGHTRLYAYVWHSCPDCAAKDATRDRLHNHPEG